MFEQSECIWKTYYAIFEATGIRSFFVCPGFYYYLICLFCFNLERDKPRNCIGLGHGMCVMFHCMIGIHGH